VRFTITLRRHKNGEGNTMNNPPPELHVAAQSVIAEIRRHMVHRTTPLLVALDGPSGSGKSALAALVVAELGAALIPSDDFYAANIPDAQWDARTPATRAADAIDWRRLRAEALVPLLSGRPAKWHAFDFEAGTRPDGTYAMRTDFAVRQPAAVVVLDGAYSARPELADLIDLAVLVDAPIEVRHARLAAREEAHFLAAWHARWDAPEAYYFSQVRPRASFDLVVTTG
jgi:para-aminobenzoate synthetase